MFVLAAAGTAVFLFGPSRTNGMPKPYRSPRNPLIAGPTRLPIPTTVVVSAAAAVFAAPPVKPNQMRAST